MVLCAPEFVTIFAIDVAGLRIDDVPVRSFERRHIQESCRPARSPVGRSRRRRLDPRSILSVARSKAAIRLIVVTYSRPVAALAAMPLTFSGSLPGATSNGRDAAHEPVAVIHVEDEDADAAVLDVVANARFGDVEEMALGVLVACASVPKRRRSE